MGGGKQQQGFLTQNKRVRKERPSRIVDAWVEFWIMNKNQSWKWVPWAHSIIDKNEVKLRHNIVTQQETSFPMTGA